MTITISKDVLAQELDGETVLLDLGSESYFGLDEVGTRVWQLINEGRVASEVVDIMLGEYEVERDVLEQDIAQLLDRLTEAVDGTTTVAFGYNGDGVRVRKVVDGTATEYVQDVAAPLPVQV